MSHKQHRYHHGRDLRRNRRSTASEETGGAGVLEESNNNPVVVDADTANVLKMFKSCQCELDARYDKYERLVKKSRDVTIEAKRIIFLLHRITRDDQREDILKEAGRRLSDLQNGLLKSMAIELSTEDPYLFLRACSPGLQEFIEALTYYHYLKDQRLIPYQEVQSLLTVPTQVVKVTESGNHDFGASGDTDPNVDTKYDSTSNLPEIGSLLLHLPPSEYILGIADLTGELMRRCINCIGAGNLSAPFELLTFLRQILEGFSVIGNVSHREIKNKIRVLRQSVDKVENACYAIQVRRSEFPDCKLNPEMLLLSSSGGRIGVAGGVDDDDDQLNSDVNGRNF